MVHNIFLFLFLFFLYIYVFLTDLRWIDLKQKKRFWIQLNVVSKDIWYYGCIFCNLLKVQEIRKAGNGNLWFK